MCTVHSRRLTVCPKTYRTTPGCRVGPETLQPHGRICAHPFSSLSDLRQNSYLGTTARYWSSKGFKRRSESDELGAHRRCRTDSDETQRRLGHDYTCFSVGTL